MKPAALVLFAVLLVPFFAGLVRGQSQ